MEIFNNHEDIISGYSSFVSGCQDISDDNIKVRIGRYFKSKKLCPRRSIHFNPVTINTPNNRTFYTISPESRKVILKGLFIPNHHIFTKEIKFYSG
jgi:hypothetical protein